MDNLNCLQLMSLVWKKILWNLMGTSNCLFSIFLKNCISCSAKNEIHTGLVQLQ